MTFPYQDPWESVDDSASLVARLQQELPSGHELESEVVQVLARRLDSDDILVELRDGRLAMLHPTWCRRSRPALPFPHFVLFIDHQDFLDQVYKPEREQWNRDNPRTEWDEMLP